jgi:hypothetical protein
VTAQSLPHLPHDNPFLALLLDHHLNQVQRTTRKRRIPRKSRRQTVCCLLKRENLSSCYRKKEKTDLNDLLLIAGAASPSDASAAGLSEKDKKVRNLEKKLRQIRDLKDRQSKGDTLEATQVSRLEG